MELPYYSYSQWLKNKYGCKVYKIPINTGCSCPNRDGVLGYGGCIFCGEKGGSNESLSSEISIEDQLTKNIAYIGSRYHAEKFIPFFQNFTNTYLPYDKLEDNLLKCLKYENIVGISIATRPDCITEKQLSLFSNIQEEYHIDICIELGLQTANNSSLKLLERHHTLGDFIESAIRIKSHHLELCTHAIIDLPWDNEEDVIETAKIISAVDSDFVKCHSLYIEKGTKLEKIYQQKKVQLLTLDDYLKRAELFLGYLDSQIAVQRIIGRVPEKDSVISNWNQSWWKIRDELVNKMAKDQISQGILRKNKRAKIEQLLN